MKKIIPFVIILLIFSGLSIFNFALADEGGGSGPEPGIPISLDNPLGETETVGELLQKIIRWLITIGAPIATAMVIYGAFQILFAAGNEDNFKSGKKTILYAVIGYAILFISLGITNVITELLQ